MVEIQVLAVSVMRGRVSDERSGCLQWFVLFC